MKLSGLIDALIASGGSVEQVRAVVAAAEAEEEQRRGEEAAWRATRMLVFDRDGPFCRYCGESVGLDFHCDHVVPRSKGGHSTLDNLAVSCRRCNVSKRASDLNSWRRR